MQQRRLRLSLLASVLCYVLFCSIPTILAQSILDKCYLLTDSSSTLLYLNATVPKETSLLATSLQLSPECTTIVSTAFDNSSTIYATCTGPAKAANYTKVYAFDLSGKQIAELPDALPLCRGNGPCKLSWIVYDTVRKVLYARLDMSVPFYWIPYVISWNATTNAWTIVTSLPSDCANPFSSFRFISGVIDHANQRLIGNCEMNTIFDLDISPASPSPREVFLWDVQDFHSPLFIYPDEYSKGSDYSTVAFVSTFLNSEYAPVTQSMRLDRMKLRKQKWNIALGAATPATFTPVSSTFQQPNRGWLDTISFVTTENYESASYYLMVQVDYHQSTVSLFPQLNRFPVMLPMRIYGDIPSKASALTAIHSMVSCPPYQ